MDIHESIESIENYLGEKKDCNIHLIWQEKFSQFYHQYIVEKSIDGVEWIELGIGKISTQESIAQNLEWLDTSNTFEKAYYRLKYIDPFGLKYFSKIITIENECHKNLSKLYIYPNPVQNILNIKNLQAEYQTDITIINSMGKKVYQSTIENSLVDVSQLLARNYYLLIQQNHQSQILPFTIIR